MQKDENNTSRTQKRRKMDQKDQGTIEAINEIINVQLQSAKHCWIAGKKEKEQGEIDESQGQNKAECYRFIGWVSKFTLKGLISLLLLCFYPGKLSFR